MLPGNQIQKKSLPPNQLMSNKHMKWPYSESEYKFYQNQYCLLWQEVPIQGLRQKIFPHISEPEIF